MIRRINLATVKNRLLDRPGVWGFWALAFGLFGLLIFISSFPAFPPFAKFNRIVLGCTRSLLRCAVLFWPILVRPKSGKN